MSKKIINILCVIFMIQSITSCKIDTFDMYKDSMYEDWQDPKDRKAKGNENDVNDLSNCEFLTELGKWQKSKYGYKHNQRYVWDRRVSWFDGKIISEGGFSLDFNIKDNSSYIVSQSNFYPVYIGPWHPITLTRTEGSFFSKQKIKEEKIIRFFAYQKTEGGRIYSQYESQTEENKKIKEKPFSLSPTGKIVPDRSDLCTVKWIAKFGYNAVAEVKSKDLFNGIFSFTINKNYLVPTGKIIEAEE